MLVLSKGLVEEVQGVVGLLSHQHHFSTWTERDIVGVFTFTLDCIDGVHLRPQLVDQLGVVFDQEGVVLPVEVDVLQKLFLADLLSLSIKIAF